MDENFVAFHILYNMQHFAGHSLSPGTGFVFICAIHNSVKIFELLSIFLNMHSDTVSKTKTQPPVFTMKCDYD